jgi:hypothetical protein
MADRARERRRVRDKFFNIPLVKAIRAREMRRLREAQENEATRATLGKLFPSVAGDCCTTSTRQVRLTREYRC